MTWDGANAIRIFLKGGAAVIAFDQVLDEFSTSFVKDSVGRAYAANTKEEAEWNGFFRVVRVEVEGIDVCRWALYSVCICCMWLLLRWTWTPRKGSA